MGFYTNSKPKVVVNEAYFGKTPKVLRIEKVIAELKSKYDGNVLNPKITVDPLWDKLGKAIHDAFGINCVFEISTTTMANMATYPIGLAFDVALKEDLRKQVIIDKEGYRYSPKANYYSCFVIYTGLFFDKACNAGEVTAVLLHEIGHNFTAAAIPIGALDRLFSILTFFTILGLAIISLGSGGTATFVSATMAAFMLSNTGKKLIDRYYKYMKVNFPNYYKMENYIGSLYSSSMSILQDALATYNFFTIPARVLSNLSSFLAGTFKNVITTVAVNSIANPRNLIYGYDDEVFGDSFPTMYGYGPELASAFDKMNFDGDLGTPSITGKAMRMCPIYSNLVDLTMLPFQVMIEVFDEHPTFPTRYLTIKRNLEHNLNNKNISPKDRQRIKNDLNKVQKQIDKLTDINANSPYKDFAMVRKIYYAFIYHVLGGDLKSRVYVQATGEKIDKQFNRLKNLEFK